MVNGEPITNFDIEQRTKLNFLTTHKQTPRQEVINELIDEKVKIKEGKKFGVDPAVLRHRSILRRDEFADADHAGSADEIAGEPGHPARNAEGPPQGRHGLDQPGARPLQGEPAGRRKGRRRRGPGRRRADPDRGFRIPDAADRPDRAAGAAPAAIELRQKEAEALRDRVQSCEEANSYFKSMQNAAIRDIVTKTSADIPVPLRELLDKTPIGHLTAPEITKQGVEMVALCGRKPTTVDTPKKREIRDKMYAEKYEAKSKAYLQEIRKAAMIEYR